MDEPKRYKFDELHRPSYDEPIGQAVYFYADDRAIVQALAVRKACHDAGLLDEHGNLRRIIGTLPVTADGVIFGLWCNCYATHEGDLLECGPIGIRDDDDGVGVVVTLRDVSGYEHEREPQQLYSTREAAERAAGGTDGR